MSCCSDIRVANYSECITTQVRSFDEIMTDATNAEDIDELGYYYKELFDNKYKYPLTCLEFANEYFKELINKL
jgi:hypothetical protein